MSDILSTSVELSVGFLALLIMTKLLGKTSLAQVTPFDFISALILGELVGNAIYDDEVRLGTILYSVAFWGLLVFLIEFLTQKFRKTRGMLEGNPSVVIRNGRIDREQMKKNKVDLNELQNLLRQQSVFSMREVAYAIIETDGSVTVLKKSQYDQPTNKDLNVPSKAVYLPITLISDGQIDDDNLEQAGLSREWLQQQLRERNISSPDDVFFLEWKQDEGVYIDLMDNVGTSN
ncbi:probable membrane protein YetF [Geomicrobium sp. JCM 19037]|uniref:YetF domain-containing protein n=1 Tax=Geomicrobium sp. JCM 19037 TaxID=1460634 RepID=UPI00045F1FAF|nr:DUF421 domain-containing protein [Geomicrobium sp. JCM 19037]GAK04244.1 probable membrane protein YetF [Geomicrobium sp. JCM 19037]